MNPDETEGFVGKNTRNGGSRIAASMPLLPPQWLGWSCFSLLSLVAILYLLDASPTSYSPTFSPTPSPPPFPSQSNSHSVQATSPKPTSASASTATPTTAPTTAPTTTAPTTTAPTSPLPPFVRSIHCIPKVCHDKPRFQHHPNFTLLVSFPGSGNTWARTIVESGTKIWTGSLYTDRSLFGDGFKGELVDPFAKRYSPHSVIKSHQPYFNVTVNAKTRAVVVLMRSPFDAALAEFTRTHGKGASHRSTVSNATLLQHYPQFFEQSIKRWFDFCQFWLGPMRRRNDSHVDFSTQFGATSFEYTRHLVSGHSVQVLVLFYEDLVRHYFATSLRLFDFLKRQLGGKMPTTAVEAVVCSVTGRELAKEKRRHREEGAYNVYEDPTNKLARRSLVQQACEVWTPYWFGDVWGTDCSEAAAMPQANRLPVSRGDVARLQALTEDCRSP